MSEREVGREGAAQTLNSSVSTALQYSKTESVPEFENADGTAIFCAVIIAAFDILNSRARYDKDTNEIGIHADNIIKVQMQVVHIINYLKNLTTTSDTNTLTVLQNKS